MVAKEGQRKHLGGTSYTVHRIIMMHHSRNTMRRYRTAAEKIELDSQDVKMFQLFNLFIVRFLCSLQTEQLS